MKKILIIMALLLGRIGISQAQTQTTVTGTVDGATSGYVEFRIMPWSTGVQYYVAGATIIANQTTRCGIDTFSQVKNTALTGPCLVWGNNLISPANTTYTVVYAPANTIRNTVARQNINGTTYDLTRPVFAPVVNLVPQYATITTSPIAANIIPAAGSQFNLGSSQYPFAGAYIDQVFASTFNIDQANASTLTVSDILNIHGLNVTTLGSFNNVGLCDPTAVASMSVQLAALISNLPSSGGIVDCRSLTGAQTISSNVFNGITKPVSVLLGDGVTITVSTNQTIPNTIYFVRAPSAKFHINTGVTIAFASLDNFDPKPTQFWEWAGTGKVTFTSAGTGDQHILPQWWGLGTTAFSSVLPAVCAAIVSNSTVVFPQGTYAAGTARCDVPASRNYVTIRGAGMGSTTLTYTSQLDAHALLTNESGSTNIGYTVEDLTLSDLTVSGSVSYGVGIKFYPSTQFVVRRVEFKNTHGNSAIQGGDGLFAAGGDPAKATAVVEDCWFHNPDYVSDRDAINIGGMREIIIRNNRIEDFQEYGFEGGGAIYRLIITGNRSKSAVGKSHLSNIAGENVLIANNEWLDLDPATTNAAIWYINEGTDLTNSLLITGNIIYNANGPAFAFGQGDMPHAKISGNTIRAAGLVTNMPLTFTDIEIDNNSYYDTRATSTANAAIRACCDPGPVINGIFAVHDNVGDSSTHSFKWVNIGTGGGESWLNLKTTKFKFWNNKIGNGLSDAASGQVEGTVNVGSTPDANAGAISAGSTVTMIGALTSDTVIVNPNSANILPVGVTVWAQVSTDNTIRYWTDNRSGSNFTGSGYLLRFAIRRQ